MKKWTRWEDWVAVAVGLIVGVWALVTPAVGASLAFGVVLGVLLIVSGLVNLARPGLVAMEYAQCVLGIVLFLGPWLGGYTSNMGLAWASWLGGAVVAVISVLAIRPSMRAHEAVTH